MKKEEKEALKQQMKKYEKLGAVKFQKYVFIVEKVKFKIIKKLFPNYLMHYDKFNDHFKEKALKKATTEEEANEIKNHYKMLKMQVRKEYYQEKNINYHIDRNNPTEIKHFLEWNKSIHERGLIKNAIIAPIAIALIALGIPIAGIPLLVYEIISAGINFECVNIQKYNLCRYEYMKEFLERRKQSKIERNVERYGEASKVIYDCIEQNENLPTFDQILDRVESKEQLEQLKQMLLEAMKERENNKNESLEKSRGVK